jgi:two-component system sensor histidine kinase KdpD
VNRRRGQLRVYLGAAPGVGKTFKMLEEGTRRRERGTDVVVGLVETHGRPLTAALVEGFEVVPRRTVEHRGARLHDLDVDAVLARHPQVVLVDEMAHTNAPGGRHAKRWEDIDELLDAGIDVITTVNVQHLESLNDAVLEITGVLQRETVPDHVVRRADQIELVDMTPEALRRRITHGNVYPPERIEPSLTNYFRPGNLTALRELALLWVADRVDDELAAYRARHGIDRPWETRERIVVAITGAPSGATVIRRAARIAERSRADLLGVHVRRADGLGTGDGAGLAANRQLLADLGGNYHEIVGDDPATQLARFARAENATQLVLGTTRRTRWEEIRRGSIINRAIRAAPDLDVLVIAVDHHDRPTDAPAQGTRRVARVAPRRRALAWGVALAGPPLLTLAIAPFRDDEGLPTALPAYMLLVVGAALAGGAAPAVVAGVMGFVFGNLFLTRPYGTLQVDAAGNVAALAAFIGVAVVVALVVGRLGVRTAEAERGRAQASALASAAASLADPDAVAGLLDKLRSVIDVNAVAVLDGDTVVAVAGDPAAASAPGAERIGLPDKRQLVTSEPVTDAEDRLIVRAFADQLAAALRRGELAATERDARTLAEIDHFRTALLRAVSHDLRSPLASIKAAASSLQQHDVDWPPEAVDDFVDTIVEEADRLDRIVANLLDASRLEAGVLAVHPAPVALDDLIERVRRTAPPTITLVTHSPTPAPTAVADLALLERVVENLLANCGRYAPGPVELDVTHDGTHAFLRVIDHGPGVDPAGRVVMFEGFQRLDDHGPGVGLGLAVAHGFIEAMGATLHPSDTPGGGLTMTIALPLDDRTGQDRARDRAPDPETLGDEP